EIETSLELRRVLFRSSLFNEALTNDRETMMMLHRIQEERRESGQADEKPVGPRGSQVSEEARRLGEGASLIRWLGGVIVAASPKIQGGKIPKAEPYPRAVMVDGATGTWTGKPTASKKRRDHERRVALVKKAAERHKQAQQG